MVRNGHGDGLNFFIVEDLLHIGVAFGLLAGGLLDQGLGAFEGGLIHVAEGDNVGLGQVHVLFHVSLTASAQRCVDAIAKAIEFNCSR